MISRRQQPIHNEGSTKDMLHISPHWSVSSEEIFSNPLRRLDARHFDPSAKEAVERIANMGVDMKPLSDLASVELRNIFSRIWADDSKHGTPYLNSTDLLSLFAIGQPSGGKRYLSHATRTDIKSLLINEGWLLMTCSGTIGRVFYVPERLHGWAATHDLIRIVPKEEGMTGYLYAYLNSDVAQIQILRHTHGGQIDHVTDDQVAGCLVPMLDIDVIKRINNEVMAALLSREQAIRTLMNMQVMQ